MPSASAKLEKQASTDALDSVKQIVTIVEKKVRNLEKRKGKLDVYKQDSQAGKELNEDQKKAVEKYDQVLELLDFAKDLQKQFNTVILESSRLQKKLAKQEKSERHHHELQRIKEIIVYQDLLNNMGTEEVRQDFLNGNKGAVKLTTSELNTLDDLYKVICPERDFESFVELPDDKKSDFDNVLTAAAENTQFLLDAKNKEAFGTTYKGLRETLQKISQCSYFSTYSQPTESKVAHSIEVEDDKESLEEHYSPQAEASSPEIEDYVMVQNVGAAADIDKSYYQVESSTVYAEKSQPIQEVLLSQANLNFLQDSQIDIESPYSSAPYSQQQTDLIRRPGEELPVHQVGGKLAPDFQSTSSIPPQTFANQSFHPMVGNYALPGSFAAPMGVANPQGAVTTGTMQINQMHQPPMMSSQQYEAQDTYQSTNNNPSMYMNRDALSDNSSYCDNLKRGMPSRTGLKGSNQGGSQPRPSSSNPRGGRMNYRN